MQICPMLENERRAAAAAASAMSASSSTTNGTLAAELERQALHRVGARAHHRLSGGGRGGRGDHARRRDGPASAAPASGPVPGMIVEHAGGQARVGETLHDQADRQRRLVRRLDDQRAAGGQRGTDFPGVNVDGIVPGRDRADHADRRGDDEAANVARATKRATCRRRAVPPRHNSG